jgi:hypothetical protein
MMGFNPSSLPDRLRNNKDFLRIGVLNFGPGRVAAYIDISTVGIVRIVNETSATRNWLRGWELRLCGRAARRRRRFGLRRGTPARSCCRGRGRRNDPLRRLRLLPRWALGGCSNGVSRSGDVRSCRCRRSLRWVVAVPPQYLHRRGSDTIRTDRDAAGHTVRTDRDTAGDMVRSNRNIASRSTSSEQNRS